MLNEAEIDQLRQLVHAYSLSDVLRGLQHVTRLEQESAEGDGRAANARAWRNAGARVGAAAHGVFGEIG